MFSGLLGLIDEGVAMPAGHVGCWTVVMDAMSASGAFSSSLLPAGSRRGTIFCIFLCSFVWDGWMCDRQTKRYFGGRHSP